MLNEHQLKTLKEAKEILSTRGNATDVALFDRLAHYEQQSRQATYLTNGGTRRDRTRKDISFDCNVATELALILSWQSHLAGYAPTFWNMAAHYKNIENEK